MGRRRGGLGKYAAWTSLLLCAGILTIFVPARTMITRAEVFVTETGEDEITVQYEAFPAGETPPGMPEQAQPGMPEQAQPAMPEQDRPAMPEEPLPLPGLSGEPPACGSQPDGAASAGLPAETYLWNGQEYRLKSYQLISVPVPEIVKHVQRSVLYEGVEQAAELPDTIEVAAADEDSGRSAAAVLPLTDTVFSNWRWIGGFTFPVTVRGYDTGSFVLGDETVPVAEEHPFAGHEEDLLRLIGADPEFYRIDTAEWDGEAKTGDDGLIYRQAVASGEKYVADVEAVYSGRAVIPGQQQEAYQAVYVLAEPDIPPETETEPPMEVSEPETAVEVTAAPVPAAAARSGGLMEWFRNFRNVTTVVIGLGVLLMFPFFLFLVRKRRRSGDRTGNEKGGHRK